MCEPWLSGFVASQSYLCMFTSGSGFFWHLAAVEGKMSGPVQSHMWSTDTLDDGVDHVMADSELAQLNFEEQRLERLLKDYSFLF